MKFDRHLSSSVGAVCISVTIETLYFLMIDISFSFSIISFQNNTYSWGRYLKSAYHFRCSIYGLYKTTNKKKCLRIYVKSNYTKWLWTVIPSPLQPPWCDDVNNYGNRDHFVCVPSQWETTLLCNVVSYWLSAPWGCSGHTSSVSFSLKWFLLPLWMRVTSTCQRWYDQSYCC